MVVMLVILLLSVYISIVQTRAGEDPGTACSLDILAAFPRNPAKLAEQLSFWETWQALCFP